jgi:hypothetical protein
VKSAQVEGHVLQQQDVYDLPTADDPHGTSPQSGRVRELHRSSNGPTYEAGQGSADPSTGGSTDPNNSMTHANSGKETEMEENMSDVDNQNRTQPQEQGPVDGYTDTEGPTDIDSPDPGNEQKIKPLDPDEYARAQKEARADEEHER